MDHVQDMKEVEREMWEVKCISSRGICIKFKTKKYYNLNGNILQDSKFKKVERLNQVTMVEENMHFRGTF